LTFAYSYRAPRRGGGARVVKPVDIIDTLDFLPADIAWLSE